MAFRGDEGRDTLRKAAVRGDKPIDPRMSEWGNPQLSAVSLSAMVRKQTRRTETSKYPEEKKSTEIPLVVASESGRGQ